MRRFTIAACAVAVGAVAVTPGAVSASGDLNCGDIVHDMVPGALVEIERVRGGKSTYYRYVESNGVPGWQAGGEHPLAMFGAEDICQEGAANPDLYVF